MCLSRFRLSTILASFFAAALLFPIGSAVAQDWTDWQGPTGGPRLRARLLDKEENAALKTAAVEVEVQNAFLDYPEVSQQAGVPEGVLQYQLDSCASIVTTDTRLRFQQLKHGLHTIGVSLLGLDNRALAPHAQLKFEIP